MQEDAPPATGSVPPKAYRPATFEEAHAIVTGKYHYDDVDEATGEVVVQGPEWPFEDWGTLHDRDEPTKEAF